MNARRYWRGRGQEGGFIVHFIWPHAQDGLWDLERRRRGAGWIVGVGSGGKRHASLATAVYLVQTLHTLPAQIAVEHEVALRDINW